MPAFPEPPCTRNRLPESKVYQNTQNAVTRIHNMIYKRKKEIGVDRAYQNQAQVDSQKESDIMKDFSR